MSHAVKFDNRLYQQYHNRQSSSFSRESERIAMTKTNNLYRGVEDMEIHTARLKLFTKN